MREPATRIGRACLGSAGLGHPDALIEASIDPPRDE
jgi:hypothetical protein